MHKLALLLLPALLLAGLAGCGANPPTEKQRIRAVFDRADLDHDEQLTPDEFGMLPLQGVAFAELDSDGNGRISAAELQSYVVWRRVEAEGRRPVLGRRADAPPGYDPRCC